MSGTLENPASAITLTSTQPDLIQFVEDAYDIHRSEGDWLRALCRNAISIYGADWMVSSIGYHVNFANNGRTNLSNIVGIGEYPPRVIEGLRRFNHLDSSIGEGNATLR